MSTLVRERGIMVVILVADTSQDDGDMSRRIRPGLMGFSMVFLLLSWLRRE
jgi:hypothetical protein